MTLINLLREGAVRAPDRPLVVTRDRAVTYEECLSRSEAFARGLRARSIDRFACVLGDVPDLIALLCGSSAVGSEACVYPAAGDDATIDEYLATFEQPVVVADRKLSLGHAEVLPVEELLLGGATPRPIEGRAPTLILTTGTTGKHRGVRHDWARLVAATRRSNEWEGARWLLAYNLHQFAGTQMLLHVLASTATLVVPPSQRPRDAVEVVRDLGVTHASATPTFWRFFTAQLDAQTARALPLRQITLGGEAVPASVIDSLTRLFPAANISQVYAGSEFGSVGSVRDGRNGLPLSVLDRPDDADVRLRIVDGELQIRSRVRMLGYYGEPDVEDEWVPTGDLVKIEGDRIFFVGRVSETINVGGVKVHPLPVEEAVGHVDGVQLARAYGRPSPVTGQIVALDVVARAGSDHERLKEAIREACSSLPDAARPRRIRFVDEIEVRGHKIARSTS